MIYFLIYLLLIAPLGIEFYPTVKESVIAENFPEQFKVILIKILPYGFAFLWVFLFWMIAYFRVKNFLTNLFNK